MRLVEPFDQHFLDVFVTETAIGICGAKYPRFQEETLGLISDVLSADFDRGLLSMPGKATYFWPLGPSAAASAPFIDLNEHNLEQICVF